MANSTLTFYDQQQNRIIFALSFLPIVLNGFVAFATLKPKTTTTKEIQSPSFQMLGFFTLNCLFTSIVWLTIPCGIWGFNENLMNSLIIKIIGTLS